MKLSQPPQGFIATSISSANILGTAYQVIVTSSAGVDTLSTPQNIDTTSSVTFGSITNSALTPNGMVYAGAAGLETSTASPANGQVLIGSTSSAPTLGTISGTTNQVTVANGAGTITLSTPQNLNTSAAIQFGSIGINQAIAGSDVLDVTGTSTHTGTSAATSGTLSLIGLTGIYTDGGTTSTTIVNSLLCNPTVNYTAASKTGKVNVIRIAPTFTSLPTGQNAGLVFSSAFANANSTTPPLVFENQTDEDTNYERAVLGWHLHSNIFSIRTEAGGTGSTRNIQFYYSNSASVALVIPVSSTGSVSIGPSLGTSLTSATTNGRVLISQYSITATSGSDYPLLCQTTYSPTSTSTMGGYQLVVAPVVNYSNATPGAGYVYGIYLNPTLTAQPTGNSAGIAFSSAYNATTSPPAIAWNNQSDEQTNFEAMRAGWGIVSSNVWGMGIKTGGTGTARQSAWYTSGLGLSAITVGTGAANAPLVILALASTSSAFTAGAVQIGGTAQFSRLTSANYLMEMNPVLLDNASNSSCSWYVLGITPTINYSAATKTGQVYGIYVNPVNTSLPTGINAGIALALTASGLTGAVLFHNQTDETTNYEYVSQGYTSNVWTLQSVKGGSGTLRAIQLGAAGNTVQHPAGSGTATFQPEGNISTSTTSAATTQTTKQTLATYTLPANSLSAAGKGLYIVGVFKTAANTNSKTMTIDWGSQTSVATATTTTSGDVVILELWLTKSGSNTQAIIGQARATASTIPIFTSGTQTDSSTITINFTATTGGATGDATFEMYNIAFLG